MQASNNKQDSLYHHYLHQSRDSVVEASCEIDKNAREEESESQSADGPAQNAYVTTDLTNSLADEHPARHAFYARAAHASSSSYSVSQQHNNGVFQTESNQVITQNNDDSFGQTPFHTDYQNDEPSSNSYMGVSELLKHQVYETDALNRSHDDQGNLGANYRGFFRPRGGGSSDPRG